ncbi:surface glycoprotein [Halopenitus salinus]|uniref:Surface glycoprotein n=1 Tax=Halopenitus salinus TaxID=1198295 RepID=A0ABD5UUB7_9EURY
MTTDERTFRKRSRAVFLAAVMVLSVAALSTGFAGSAAAAEVAVGNSDDLQNKIDAANTGDTLIVKEGTYSGVTITTDGITLKSASDADPTIEGGIYLPSEAEGEPVGSVSGLTVDGFVIQQTTEGSQALDIQTGGSSDNPQRNIKFINNTIKAPNDGYAVFHGGNTKNVTYEKNTFTTVEGATANKLVFIGGERSYGSDRGSTEVNITNNTFSGSTSAIDATPKDGVGLEHEASESKIKNNDFSGILDSVNKSDNVVTIFKNDSVELGENGLSVTSSEALSNQIQPVITFVGSGQTVNINSGDYQESLTINTEVIIRGPYAGVSGDRTDRSDESEATIVGNHDINANSVIVNGVEFEELNKENAVKITGESVTINNSVFDGPSTSDFNSRDGYAVWVEGRNAKISENEFTGFNGGVQLTSDSATVESNVINSDVTGIGQSSGSDAIASYIANNTIDTGVQGISGWNTDDMVITNNTITVNDSEYTERGNFQQERSIDISGDNVSVTNNTIESTETGILVESSATADVTIRRNNVSADEFAVNASEYEHTLDATLNYWNHSEGPNAAAGNGIEGDVTYDPFLTTQPDQLSVDTPSETTEFGHDLTVPADGNAYAVAFPAPVNGTVSEVFGDVDGVVYAHDGNEWQTGSQIADQDVNALDAFVVINEGEEDLHISFEYQSDDGVAPSMTSADLEAGWNYIGAPQSGGSDEAFSASTASVERVVNPMSGPDSVPYDVAGDETLVGSSNVGPFRGYWVFATDDGEIGATVVVDPTQDQEQSALSQSS